MIATGGSGHPLQQADRRRLRRRDPVKRGKERADGVYHADWEDVGGRGQVDRNGDSLSWSFVPADHGYGFADVVRATAQSIADYRRDGPPCFIPTAAMAALDRHLGIERKAPASDLDARSRELHAGGSAAGREAAGEVDAYQAWLRKHR